MKASITLEELGLNYKVEKIDISTVSQQTRVSPCLD